MKKDTIKKLNDVLEIADDIIDIDVPEKKDSSPTVNVDTTDLTSDYNYSRDQYHNLENRIQCNNTIENDITV